MDKDLSYSGLVVKSLRVLYVVLGFLPSVWLVSFLAVIAVASLKLGGIPHNMVSPTPSALGLQSYAYMSAMVGAMSLIAMFAWPVISLVVLLTPWRTMVLTKRPFIFFVIGVAGYLFFGLQMPGVLVWVTG
jgi:hypothetical protein